MIQLVISDIDGTLLPHGATQINPAVFPEIARLRAQGILFCPASGRQYASLRHLFAPITDELCYICENGSIVYGAGAAHESEVLHKITLPAAETQQLCAEVMQLPGVEIVISGANTSYLCPKERDISHHLIHDMGNQTVVLASPADVPEDVLKVSLFSPDGMTPALYDLQARWGSTFDAVVSGKEWMDFSKSDKRMGVQCICDHLGIAPEHILAVGDNYNDVGMLQMVGHPYLMDTAVPALKEQLSIPTCAEVAALLQTVGQ